MGLMQANGVSMYNHLDYHRQGANEPVSVLNTSNRSVRLYNKIFFVNVSQCSLALDMNGKCFL